MKLQAAVPMPCLPACTLCHNTTAGGPDNIRIGSMGSTWPMFGLDGHVPDTLEVALANVRSAMQDTDHDGTPDDVELSMGRDPNSADPNAMVCGAGAPPAGPEYGCFRVARPAPVDNVGVVAGAFVALLGLSALRRRRR
jgi:hypothetical protein